MKIRDEKEKKDKMIWKKGRKMKEERKGKMEEKKLKKKWKRD